MIKQRNPATDWIDSIEYGTDKNVPSSVTKPKVKQTNPSTDWVNSIQYTKEEVPQSKDYSGLLSTYPGTVQSLADLQKNPLSINNPLKLFNEAKQGVDETSKNLASRAVDSVATFKSPTSTKTDKLVAAGNLLTASTHSIFADIGGVFKLAEAIPVLGTAVKLIGTGLTAVGESARNLTNMAVDNSSLTQDQKDKIKPLLGDIAEIAAQVAVPEGISKVANRFSPVEKTANRIRTKITEETPEYKTDVKKVDSNKINELTKKYGEDGASKIVSESIRISREPSVSKGELTGEFGGKKVEPTQNYGRPLSAKDIANLPKDLTTAQFEQLMKDQRGMYDTTGRPMDAATVRYLSNIKESVGFQKAGDTVRIRKPSTTVTLAQVAGKDIPVVEKPVLPKEIPIQKQQKSIVDITPKQKEQVEVKNVPKISKDIAEKLSKDFEGLPEYSIMNMEEQAKVALDLFTKEPIRAERILNGKEAPPQNLRIGALYRTAIHLAEAKGDGARLIQLAKSKLSKHFTDIGQEIKALDLYSTKADPVKIIRDLSDSLKKEASVGERQIVSERNKYRSQLNRTIKNTKISQETWSDFVEGLKC